MKGRSKRWKRSFTHLQSAPGHALRHMAESNLDALRRLGIQPAADERRWQRAAIASSCVTRIKGVASAQQNLGFMYANGRGVPQDFKEAVRWYRLAADQGHAGAQNNLGAMYNNGLGVPQDFKEAVRWKVRADWPWSATISMRQPCLMRRSGWRRTGWWSSVRAFPAPGCDA